MPSTILVSPEERSSRNRATAHRSGAIRSLEAIIFQRCSLPIMVVTSSQPCRNDQLRASQFQQLTRTWPLYCRPNRLQPQRVAIREEDQWDILFPYVRRISAGVGLSQGGNHCISSLGGSACKIDPAISLRRTHVVDFALHHLPWCGSRLIGELLLMLLTCLGLC